MAEVNSSTQLTFTSGGFELFVPPTRFSQSPARFVMLDDLNDIFYQVTYEGPGLQNPTSWTDLSLHRKHDVNIVFPPNQMDTFEARLSIMATGFLVQENSRSMDTITATHLAKVHVCRLSQQQMSWAALESLKNDELPTEMKAGLLRHVFSRRPGGTATPYAYVTSQGILDGMPRPWHRDGASLNYELDERFTGAKAIPRDQKWCLVAT